MLPDILPLGDPRLYEACQPVAPEELPDISRVALELHAVILGFRDTHGWGRAVAAPQIGCMKRLVCMYTDQPYVFINPVLHDCSAEMMELWDDCMCFPEFMVRVRRHRRCRMTFRDLQWQEHTWDLEDDLSELLQHEVDHLDGILATQRAIDGRSFALRRVVKPSGRIWMGCD